jgi:signal recognition particle receptor subunit beta
VRNVANPRRILLYGPPAAGKQTLLAAYAESKTVTVEGSVAPRGGENFPHLVKRTTDERIGIELLTMPGGVWSMDAWWPLLSAAAGVALVLDGQEAREQADREHIDALMSMTLPAVRCVVFTKEDLIAKGAVGRVSPALSADARIAGWETFLTRNDQPQTLIEPIEWLIRQVAAPPTAITST